MNWPDVLPMIAVIAVIAVTAFGVVYTWQVYLPRQDQQRKQVQVRFVAEERRADALAMNSKEMGNAIVQMCRVLGKVYDSSARTEIMVGEHATDQRRLVSAVRSLYEAFQKLRVGEDNGVQLGAAREALHDLGDDSRQQIVLPAES